MNFAQDSTAVPAQLRRLLRNAGLQEKRRGKLIRDAVTDAPYLHETLRFIDHAAIEGLYCGAVRAARRALQRSARVSLPAASVQTDPDRPDIPVPCHVLRPSHSPSVLPGLVPRVSPEFSGKPLSEVLQEVEVMQATGETSFVILDHFHGRSGMPWSNCAAILRARGMPLDDASCAMAMVARHFWNQLAEFTRIHANAVSLKQIEGATGDWAFVEAPELDAWLPGIHVPAMHRREQYLVRISSRGGSLINVDFHARSYAALFRVLM